MPDRLETAARVLGVPVGALTGRALTELGGSSLDAFRIAAALLDGGVRVAPHHLLQATDVAGVLAAAAGEKRDPAPEPPGTGERLPLTWQQRVIQFQHLMDGDSPSYLFHAVFRFRRAPRLASLRTGLVRVLERRPLLRTRFVLNTAHPYQLTPAGPVDPRNLPLQELEIAGDLTDRGLLELTDANRPFDLEHGPPVRWTLVHRPDGGALLLYTEHHLVHDGSSFMAVASELDDSAADDVVDTGYFAYAAAAQGSGDGVKDALADLRDVNLGPVEWHRAGSRPAKDQDFHLRIPVPQRLLRAVEEQAAREGVSTFAAFFAAFAGGLAQLCTGDRMVIGTGMGNRPVEHHDTVGMFVSMVPVVVSRTHPDVDSRVREAAAALGRAAVRSNVPLPEIVRHLGPAAREHGGLMSVGFSLFEQTVTSVTVGNETADLRVGLFTGKAKFPLDCVLVLRGERGDRHGELLIEGSASVVSEDDMWALWTRMVRHLRVFSGEPDEERDESGLVSSVESTAAADPARRAIVDPTRAVTYGELQRLGAAVSDLLGERLTVGILGEANADVFAAAYAVVRAGGTYVPLPAGQPVERLTTMVRAAGCDVVIDVGQSCSRELGGQLGQDVHLVGWDQVRAHAGTFELSGGPADSTLPAYVLFTSGTTGQPRGVAVSRAAIAARAAELGRLCRLETGTRMSQWADCGFDASALEMWAALLAGGELVVVPDAVRSDPARLVQWMATQVEVAFVTASVADVLCALPWPDPCRLRVLTTGAEPLHPVVSEPPFAVLNMYGPTEVTVFATAGFVDAGSSRLPTLGTALPGVVTRVVDESGAPVHEGELWVGGPDIARGYVNDAFATDARFVPDPYAETGAIVYRTGDRVRQRADGSFEYHGRSDRQVKIDGVRVELAEVEAAALRVPGIRSAAATVVEAPRGTRRLVVAVVADDASAPDDLPSHVRRVLLPQLRAATVRVVEALPTLPSGKVDLRALQTVGEQW